MPYVAKHRIDAGEQRVFAPGSEVPEEFVDEAMLEAGSVELVDSIAAGPYDGLVKKDLIALCERRGIAAKATLTVAELKALLIVDDDGETMTADDAGDEDDDADADDDGE